jgi:2-desacetyl-2-hydroxyethyl bacteriochlorophyllide A dehydrogenase
MKAAIIKGPHKIEVEDRPVPVPGPGEVLVKIGSVGICGSDVHGFLGLSGKRRLPGLIMGHEASGEIAEIGPGIQDWKKGDRVSIDPQQACGTCLQCRRGWANLCDNMAAIGSSMRNFKNGAMCEYMILIEKQLYKIPDNMSYNEGAMLDPVSNALHVLIRAQMEIGDTIAIIGTGVIGLLMVQIAKLIGAGKIIAIDASEWRLNMAKDFGADVLIDSRNSNTVDAIMAETNGRGADIVVEAVGLPITYQNAINSVKKRGKVLALGFRDPEIPIPIQPLLFREITIIGNGGFVFEIPTFINLVSTGKISVKPMITHEFPLQDVQQAFELLADASGSGSRALKVMLKP